MAETGSPLPTPDRYEATDTRVAPFVIAGGTLVALIAASVVAMVVLFKVLGWYQADDDPPLPPLAAARQVSGEPRLQVDPPAQKALLRQSETELLEGYAWVDPAQRVARIPVARAMVLLGEGRLGLDRTGR